MSSNALAYRQVAKQFPEFNDADVTEFITQFNAFDMDGSGAIDVFELSSVMKNLGETVNNDQLKQMIAAVDTDQSGEVEFVEFLQIMKNLRAGKSTQFGSVVKKVAEVIKVQGSHGAEHSFSEEEKFAFVDYINNALRDDAVVGSRLPIDPDSMDIFEQCKDGLLLCKLINDAVPETIDERVLNTTKLNAFKITENNNLMINSAKAIGCNVTNIGQDDIAQGKIHLILGLMWQIIRIGILSKISIKNVPELFRLLEEGETLDDLLKLSPDQILLRWLNYHLRAAGSDRKVKNFSSDVKDSEVYTTVLHQIKPADCTMSPMQEMDMMKRAEATLKEADKIGCRKFVSPRDIVNGNPKLNLAFVANLFNTWPSLEPLTEEEAAQLEEWLFKSEGTREARTFCLWINSLGVEPFVSNLFEDLKDGLVILKVMNKVQPGIVDWRKVNKTTPMNKFKKVENANYAVVLGKQLGFSLVGVAGSDIVDGNPTLILALVWQLMRMHVLKILTALSKDGKKITEEEILAWANGTVNGAGKKSAISGFKDSSLSSSRYYLDILSALRSSLVNYDLVTAGDNEDDAIMNAKYAISVARKYGATIFTLPEDLYEVKPKMTLIMTAGIMSTALAGSSN